MTTRLLILALTIFLNFNLSAGPNDGEGIKWLTIEEAEALMEKEPRKIFIDVYTDWCTYCKKMDKATFTDPKVIEYVNKNFYAVKLDAETGRQILFNSKLYNKSGRYNEFATEILKRKMAFPTTVYIGTDKNVVYSVANYWKAKTFLKLLTYVKEGEYANQTFDEYQKSN